MVTHCGNMGGAFAHSYHLSFHSRGGGGEHNHNDDDASHNWDEVDVKNYTHMWYIEPGGSLDVLLMYDTNTVHPADT